MVNSTFSSAFQDTTPGQLVLRVCGSTRDGQIIRLRSPKCTVGSGPRCTLRLAAGGVAPLHCLILRGPAGAVVRRWSADTRLNGQAFTDAELVPGDRLSIGSIELEVLDMGLTECEPSPAQPTGVTTPWQQQWQAEREELECQLSQRKAQLDLLQTELQSRRAEIEQSLGELDARGHALEEDRRSWQAQQAEAANNTNEQSQQLSARSAELEAQGRALAERQQQWQTERDTWEQQLSTRASQLEVMQSELQSQQAAIEQARGKLETRQNETASQAAEQSEQLAARAAELEAQSLALAERQQQWQAERDTWEQQLSTRASQLEAMQADLQSQQAAIEQARGELKARQNEAASQAAEQTEQLAARAAELEAQSLALAERQQQWQIERDAWKQQCSTRTSQLDALQAELQSRQAAIEQTRGELEARQNEAASQTGSQSEQLAARAAELEAQSLALTERQEQWQAERDAWEQQLSGRTVQLEAMQAELEERQEISTKLLAELETREQALEEDRRRWEAQREESPSAVAEPADEQPETVEDESASDTSVNACEPSTAGDKPSGAAPVSLADVLRRVGAADLLKEEQAPAEEDAEPAFPPVQAAVENQPIEAAYAPEPSPKAPPHHDGEEESIDDYMSRLMERVRSGSSGSASSTRLPATWSQSPAVSTASPPEPEAEEPAPVQAQESPQAAPVVTEKPQQTAIAPRTVAPEKQAGLSAMRALANLSAKSAIGQHDRRQLILATRVKLLIAVMGAAVCATQFWLWRMPGANPITLHAAVASLIVTIYWGTQYAISTGHLIIGRFGRVEWKWESSRPEGKRD